MTTSDILEAAFKLRTAATQFGVPHDRVRLTITHDEAEAIAVEYLGSVPAQFYGIRLVQEAGGE